MNNKIKETLNNIINRFKTGDIPQAITYSMFPIPNIPASKWSLFNRTLLFFSDTEDARGFKQWQSIKRFVKKGAKAIYILAPRFKKKETDKEEDKLILTGFLTIPVFRYEDTDGEQIDYKKNELPKFYLINKAKEWGINIKSVGGNDLFYGKYSPKRKEISLATKEECVFFHELAHAAHERVKGKLKKGQDWKQEIIAELSASVLCQLVGKNGDKYLGNNYKYIDRYAKKNNSDVLNSCLKVFKETELVLNEILF